MGNFQATEELSEETPVGTEEETFEGEGFSKEQRGPIDYSVPLPSDRRRTLGRWLLEEILRAREETEDRRNNLRQYRYDWSMFPWRGGTRWEGSADIPAPATRYAVDAHHARLNQQILAAEPVFVVEAKTKEASAYASQIEEALSAKLEEAGWYDASDELHSELPLAGNCFFRVTYEWRTRRVPKITVEFNEREFYTLLLAGADPLTAQMAAVKKQGAEEKLHLEFEDVLEYQGSAFKTIPFEDGVIFPTSIRDPEQARGIGERVRLTGWELKRGMEAGKYIREEVLAILGRSSDPHDEEREELLDMQGVDIWDASTPLSEWEPLWREYEFWEVELRMDANEDGKEEIVLVDLHAETGRIIRIAYSPYEHGQFTYHMFRHGVMAGELYGYGTAETVAALQDAWSAVLNAVTDHTDLALAASATFFVNDQAGLDPDRFELAMGRPIRVKDPHQTIRDLPIHPLPTQVWTLLQIYKDYVDLVAGVSNPVLGKETDTPRTLGEVQIVTSQANIAFEEHAARIARQHARVWEQVRINEAQFAPDGLIRYRRKGDPEVLGEKAFGEIDAKTMLADVRLVPAGLRQISDIRSRMSQAQSAYAVLSTHPKAGTNPEIMRIALEEFLRSMKYARTDSVLAALDKEDTANVLASGMPAEQAGMPPEQAGMPAEQAGMPAVSRIPVGELGEVVPPEAPSSPGLVGP